MSSAGNSSASTPAPPPQAPAVKTPQSPRKSLAGFLHTALNINACMTLIGLVFTIAAFTWGIKSYQAAALSNRLSQSESCRMHPVRSQASFLPFPNESQHDQMLQTTPLCQEMREAGDYDRLSKREAVDTATKYLWFTRERSIELRQTMSEQFSLLRVPLRRFMIVCFDISQVLFSLVLPLLQAAWKDAMLSLKLSSIYIISLYKPGIRAIESFNFAILSRVNVTSYRYIFLYIATIAPFCLHMYWSKGKFLSMFIFRCTGYLMVAELLLNVDLIPISVVALLWTAILAAFGLDAMTSFIMVCFLTTREYPLSNLHSFRIIDRGQLGCYATIKVIEDGFSVAPHQRAQIIRVIQGALLIFLLAWYPMLTSLYTHHLTSQWFCNQTSSSK
jgi:hypothetical protein